MSRPRTAPDATEADRDGKRIPAAFMPEEFAAIAALADEEFETLAGLVRVLTLEGLAARSDGGAAPRSGLAAVKAEEKSLRNELLQIEVAKKRRELITVEAAAKIVEEDYGIIRSRLLAIPQSVLGLSSEQLADLKKAVQDCMTDLSANQPATYEPLLDEVAAAPRVGRPRVS